MFLLSQIRYALHCMVQFGVQHTVSSTELGNKNPAFMSSAYQAGTAFTLLLFVDRLES